MKQNSHKNVKDHLEGINFDTKIQGHAKKTDEALLKSEESRFMSNKYILKKITNTLMKKGKYLTAYKILKDLLFRIKMFQICNTSSIFYKNSASVHSQLNKNNIILENLSSTKSTKKALDFLYEAILNVKPLIELEKKSKNNFSKRKSKPVVIKTSRGFKLAIEWLLEGARQRPERSISLSLYLEIVNAYQNKGYAIKKKEELHNICKNTFFKGESFKKKKRYEVFDKRKKKISCNMKMVECTINN